ncbi:MAG: hypothetical protein WCR28_04425 [Candidatus Izemoplasmatales bacterium]|nr:hypothetical protein [Acholeplasmataceae bacterium]
MTISVGFSVKTTRMDIRRLFRVSMEKLSYLIIIYNVFWGLVQATKDVVYYLAIDNPPDDLAFAFVEKT